jgi:hypothetical protein
MKTNIIGDTLPKKKRLKKKADFYWGKIPIFVSDKDPRKTNTTITPDNVDEVVKNYIAILKENDKQQKGLHNWLQRWKIKNAIRHLERLLAKYK